MRLLLSALAWTLMLIADISAVSAQEPGRVYKVGWLKEQGKDASVQAAMAKLHVSDCFVKNSLDAVQLFGASGYAADLGIERDLRDSVGSLIFSGTNDIQRNIIAQHLIR